MSYKSELEGVAGRSYVVMDSLYAEKSFYAFLAHWVNWFGIFLFSNSCVYFYSTYWMMSSDILL